MKMSRKLKALGLAVLAVCAIGAMSASAAQAGTFTAGNYPATITGIHATVQELETELGVMECGVKLHGELVEASEQLTLNAGYGTSCQLNGDLVHVNMNGCDYQFNAGATLAMDTVEGSLDIKCPTANEIDFLITAEEPCHLTIPEQLGLSQVVYRDKTMAQDVEVELDVEGLDYELDAGCEVEGAFENGSYTGDITLGADYEGMPTPFMVE